MFTDKFQEILKHEQIIHTFFERHLFIREEREDLVQETLCRAFESIGRFRKESHISTWLYSICRNVLYAHLSRKSEPCIVEDPADQRENPSDPLIMKMVIDDLPPFLKKIYEKKYIQNMKIREISDELSIPEGTVKYYLFLIRQYLKESL